MTKNIDLSFSMMEPTNISGKIYKKYQITFFASVSPPLAPHTCYLFNSRHATYVPYHFLTTQESTWLGLGWVDTDFTSSQQTLLRNCCPPLPPLSLCLLE